MKLLCPAAASSSSLVLSLFGAAYPNLIVVCRAHFLRWQQEAPLRTIDIPVDTSEDARAVECLLHFFYIGKLPQNTDML